MLRRQHGLEFFSPRKLVRLEASTEELKSGDEIAIYFDLTNTGEGPLTAITVEQQGAVAFGDALDILPANVTDSASVIFTRKLSDDDIAAGPVLESYARDHGPLLERCQEQYRGREATRIKLCVEHALEAEKPREEK